MKIVIVDLETTGLVPICDKVIEVGAVILDLATLKIVPDFFRVLIKRDRWEGDAIALSMNAKILKDSENIGIPEDKVFPQMRQWLHVNSIDSRFPLYPSLSDKNFTANLENYTSKPPRLVGCGKNFGSFDLQFLKFLPGYGSHVEFGHRSLDVGSLYLRKEDSEIPNLNECLNRAGIDKKTNHTALDDCLLVAELIVSHYKSYGH